MTEKLDDKQIIKLYKSGVRDFTGVVAPLSDFTGIDLSGACFKDADLKLSSFFRANLSNVDFSNADLKWSGFAEATLLNCKFTNADASYSDFNNGKFENTDLEDTNLEWCALFNVDISKAKIKNTKLGLAIFSPEEATLEGIKHVLEAAEGLPISKGVIENIKKIITENIGEEKVNEALNLQPTASIPIPTAEEMNDRVYRFTRREEGSSPLRLYSSGEEGRFSLYDIGRRLGSYSEREGLGYNVGRPTYNKRTDSYSK